jgi:sigma-B regulation protein RsbQ
MATSSNGTLAGMEVLARCNVRVTGRAGAPPIVFAHGFGCDQTMWRKVVPEFERDHHVVLFDLVGSGGSDLASYDPDRYVSLEAYAADVLALCRELELQDVVFVGHSVSAMIGVLAQIAEPERFAALVLVGPSARYLDDRDYAGGFSEADIAELLELMDSNHLGWQDPLAGLVMANPDRPELKTEVEASFCRTRPDIARQFARTTFLGDNREDLRRVTVPTLVLQTSQDTIAPLTAGAFVHDQIPDSRMVVIEGQGHCPHLSAPSETATAIREFLSA